MHAVLDEVERDFSVGAVIVTGRGSVFCAGGDVDEIMSTEPTDREGEFDLIRGYNRVAWRLFHLDPSVVAAVNGPAASGGAALGMACDILVLERAPKAPATHCPRRRRGSAMRNLRPHLAVEERSRAEEGGDRFTRSAR